MARSALAEWAPAASATEAAPPSEAEEGALEAEEAEEGASEAEEARDSGAGGDCDARLTESESGVRRADEE